MNARAIIFDVYGTLLEVGPPPPDGEEQWERLWAELGRAGPRLSRLEFSVACHQVIGRRHAAARARGIAWPEVHWPSVVMEVLPEVARLSPADQDEFVFRQIQTGRTTRMGAEVAAALRRLSDDACLLGIASNAQAYTVRELRDGLAPHGLALDLFDPELCFWSFAHGFSKPDPHVFQILATRLAARGIGPGEVLMVGDRLDNDIQPARVQGWQTWQVRARDDAGWAGLRGGSG